MTVAYLVQHTFGLRDNVIDHFNLPVSDFERSANFSQAVLASLDISLLMRDEDAIGFLKYSLTPLIPQTFPLVIHGLFRCCSATKVLISIT